MADSDPRPDASHVEATYAASEHAALRAAAEAQGVPVADYVHDAGLREQARQKFTAAAAVAWSSLVEEFDEKFPPPGRADRAA